MKERFVKLTAAEVRGILDGTLTSFRRPIRPPRGGPMVTQWVEDRCPFGAPGDRLWVRESWMPGYDHRSVDAGDDASICEVFYRGVSKDHNDCEFRPAPDDIAEEWSRTYSEDGDDDPRWRSAGSMPRWASRLDLEVVGSQPEKDAAGAWEWVTTFRRVQA